eukprot:765819-Hanusia_phi.AAC.4
MLACTCLRVSRSLTHVCCPPCSLAPPPSSPPPSLLSSSAYAPLTMSGICDSTKEEVGAIRSHSTRFLARMRRRIRSGRTSWSMKLVLGISSRSATVLLFVCRNMSPSASVAPGEVTSRLTFSPSLIRQHSDGSLPLLTTCDASAALPPEMYFLSMFSSCRSASPAAEFPCPRVTSPSAIPAASAYPSLSCSLSLVALLPISASRTSQILLCFEPMYSSPSPMIAAVCTGDATSRSG